jgi:hypothetical protein
MQMLAFALWEHVRFGSKADVRTAQSHVRFTPNRDRKSGHPMSPTEIFEFWVLATKELVL